MMSKDQLNNVNFHVGFTDDQLESLSQLSRRFEGGVAPWVAWESENSSFGKTFREWAYYPRCLPLYISSDHGVHWGATCWPNEVNNPCSVLFSWNRKKAQKMRLLHNKKAYFVPHPWVHYRKKHFKRPDIQPRGTLVFFAHSNTTTTPNYEDLDGYISDLKALPEKYQPVVLCLSFHDITKGLHKTLRKYDLPIVTAGTTNSQEFVDRFYSMILQFRYSSSPNIGSHTFYLLEAGVPFFLFGKHPEYHIKGSKAVKDGKQNLADYGDEEDIEKLEQFKKLLETPCDHVTPEQYAMVSEYMGLASTMSRVHASCVLWGALLRNFSAFVRMYLGRLSRLIRKIN